jgi:hypothetical protein
MTLSPGIDSEPTSREGRRAWRFVALAAGMLLVVLCAIFAAPLVFDFPYRAPSGEKQVLAENLTVTPDRGPTEQEITLWTHGLAPGTQVAILGGVDLGELRPLGEAMVDDRGNLNAGSKIPEWAVRGKPFYFVAEQDGARIGAASVNVIVLDEVAPAGAGGTPATID